MNRQHEKNSDVWAWVITVHAVIKVEEYILCITRYFNDDIGTKWQKEHFDTFSSSKWILHNIHDVLSNTPYFCAIGQTQTKICQSFSKSKSKPDITYVQNYSHWTWHLLTAHMTQNSSHLLSNSAETWYIQTQI